MAMKQASTRSYKAKSSRKGGFHTGLLMGTTIETRRRIPVD